MTARTNDSQEFIIREATRKDISQILEFINVLAIYEKLEHEVVATEKDLEKYLFGNNKIAEVVIAYHTGRPVGFALFYHNFSTFLGKPGIYLEDLFVYEQFRGRGFGRKLLVYLANLALERDCGRLEWSVLDWNEPSISFYRSLGAELKKEWLLNRLSGDSLKKLAEDY